MATTAVMPVSLPGAAWEPLRGFPTDNRGSRIEIAKDLMHVQMVAIDIEHISGKRVHER